MAGHAGDAAQVVAAAERRGGAQLARPPVPKTSVTASTTSATSRLATSTTIHLVLRVGAAPGRAEARAQVDDGDDLAAEVGHAGDGSRRVRERHQDQRIGDLLHAGDVAPRTRRPPRRSRRGSSKGRVAGVGARAFLSRPQGDSRMGRSSSRMRTVPSGAGRAADARDVRRLLAPEHARGLDLLGGQAPDLLHLVDQEAQLLALADVGQEDARLAIDGRPRAGGSGGAGRSPVTSLPRTLMTPSIVAGARGTSVMGGGRRISATWAICTA